mmetsp:Transcript_7185/g.13401  ORF Transcript_7185/g.13401 Transcript_7185/m.13401 type:complete len:509 (-) Transcript_7185:152-1678(-)|eukprot:CAMPEP_0201668188 /NCGR_PEP_ID=MMETSP0494-20130426/18355_1 /ASSEMBLY_ACC=CAM_ASM_000839 /TAXON_ID=420259 /ORGANISM="Thalassiosira gravida, Strain GMp14c1" /LENGTH=508 /DNA_ID=CAMNT_0048148459 /DNA_START=77 /DNA_END=1603 /DNA_ORIENTATION=-
MTSNVVEFEEITSKGFTDANTALRSGVRARWERKKHESNSKNADGSSDENRKPASSLSDRFIPNRAAMDMEKSSHAILSQSDESESSDPATDGDDNEEGSNGRVASDMSEYKSSVLGLDADSKSRILSFKDKAPVPKGDTVNNLQVLYSASTTSRRKNKNTTKLVSRHIPSAPSRILDAPDLLDDYYLNLLSWSDTNVLAVALSQAVYLWNAETGDIDELCNVEDEGPDAHISSVSWIQEGGGHLAVGTSWGQTMLWDVRAKKQLRKMNGHSDRVGALSWNRHVLSSGGRDNLIINHDVRIAEHKVANLASHTQEVCGLAWSPDGMTLASGANDNKLCLWDAAASSTSRPRYELTEHQAAVKALAWSPHERNLLATGGGTADRCIKFWNAQSGSMLQSVDTGSQVCALQWNPHEKEILSSHGFARNQLCLWKYPTMAKVKELEGHTARVLHMAASPDGSSVVSAAADETLRFWDVFAPPCKSSGAKRGASDLPGGAKSKKLSRTMHIR